MLVFRQKALIEGLATVCSLSNLAERFSITGRRLNGTLKVLLRIEADATGIAQVMQ
jgi:hypothetical protein